MLSCWYCILQMTLCASLVSRIGPVLAAEKRDTSTPNLLRKYDSNCSVSTVTQIVTQSGGTCSTTLWRTTTKREAASTITITRTMPPPTYFMTASLRKPSTNTSTNSPSIVTVATTLTAMATTTQIVTQSLSVTSTCPTVVSTVTSLPQPARRISMPTSNPGSGTEYLDSGFPGSPYIHWKDDCDFMDTHEDNQLRQRDPMGIEDLYYDLWRGTPDRKRKAYTP
ncbi:hypothetical protein QBC44DRAFT_306057 [Cladorrhinum sp. PSN332]|nr:hypothetical protein QBC44DRAFT_306057 [Cladorrhinum sp. PSN332]